MAACMICKKEVTTGYVLCGACAHKLEPFTLPTELAYFIDQLAEDIVLDEKIRPCDMCSIGECSSQVSGLVCRNGVKAWLLSKADKYLSKSNEQSLRLWEVRQCRPPYMKALNDISQFLQNNGYEDASKFLDCSFEL